MKEVTVLSNDTYKQEFEIACEEALLAGKIGKWVIVYEYGTQIFTKTSTGRAFEHIGLLATASHIMANERLHD